MYQEVFEDVPQSALVVRSAELARLGYVPVQTDVAENQRSTRVRFKRVNPEWQEQQDAAERTGDGRAPVLYRPPDSYLVEDDRRILLVTDATFDPPVVVFDEQGAATARIVYWRSSTWHGARSLIKYSLAARTVTLHAVSVSSLSFDLAVAGERLFALPGGRSACTAELGTNGCLYCQFDPLVRSWIEARHRYGLEATDERVVLVGGADP